MEHAKKTFILTALVVVALLLLHLLPPITLGDTTLRQVNLLADLSDAPSDAEQDGLIPLAKAPVSPDEGVGSGEQGQQLRHIDWPKNVQPIEDFSAGEAGGMEHIYAMLDSLKAKKAIGRPIRIAYYGDSFIEGDILVEYLREMMQAEFGGYGVGWVDAGNGLNQYKQTIETRSSGMSEFMAMKSQSYEARKAGIAERYYPATAGASMYFHSKNTPSSVKTADGKQQQEFPHTQKWQSARVYLLAPSAVSFQMNVSGGHTDNRSLQPSAHVQVAETDQWMNNLNVTMQSGQATLFGVALESDNGIVVDNFSMRGSSGITLSYLSEQMLTDFNAIRPYDLIIFQFGTNAITDKSGEKHLTWYMEQMAKVMNLYKKCFPETSLLIMSTPDRGARTAQGVGTMKNIEALVSYQRQLAAEHHVAFYNLFEAMGGKGSMARFCEQGMGSKDFIHINHQAGKVIAGHIFRSLKFPVEQQ